MVEKILGTLVLFGLRKLAKRTTNTIDDKVVEFVEVILGNQELVSAVDGLKDKIVK